MFPFIKSWKERIYQQGMTAGKMEAQEAAREKAIADRKHFDLIQLQMMVGAPVIRVSNEWENPTIGFGHSIADFGHSQVLVIEDYVSGRQLLGGGVCFDFSEQKLETLLRLDPYEAWAFLAHNSVGHHHFDKPHSGHRDTAPDLLEKLTKNGFFERWEKFKVEHNI